MLLRILQNLEVDCLPGPRINDMYFNPPHNTPMLSEYFVIDRVTCAYACILVLCSVGGGQNSHIHMCAITFRYAGG